EVPAQVEVVVLQEHDASAERILQRELEDALQELLPRLVGRMGLARVYDLNEPVAAGDETRQCIEVPEDQVRPLVGGKPPGKTNSQHAWIKGRCRLCKSRLGQIAPARLLDQAVTGVFDKPAFERLVRFPKFAGR